MTESSEPPCRPKTTLNIILTPTFSLGLAPSRHDLPRSRGIYSPIFIPAACEGGGDMGPLPKLPGDSPGGCYLAALTLPGSAHPPLMLCLAPG